MKKSILLSIVLLSTALFNAQVFGLITTDASSYDAYIKSVKNFALYKAFLLKNKDDNNKVAIDSNTTKNTSLKIPFVSINEYMQKFVKNIPFTPNNAIKIETQKGAFYIWASESGIVCAPDPKDLNNLDNWKAKTLFNVNKEIDICPLNFAMEVDKSGKISLVKFIK